MQISNKSLNFILEKKFIEMGCNSSIQVGLENANKKPISICILGLLNSGKTSIIEYLAGEYVLFFSF